MKLMNKFALGLSSAFLLWGCQGNANISDSSQQLMKIGDVSYTTGTEFELAKRVSGPSLTLQSVSQMICDEEIGVTDEIKKEAEEQYDTYAEGNDDFESTLKEYGYDGKQDYIDTVLIPNIQNEHLFRKYFTDNQEALEAEYTPVLVSIIETDSEDNAQKALDALKNDENPVTVAEQYAPEEAAYRGDEMLLMRTNTQLPTELVNTVLDGTSEGTVDEIFQTETDTDTVTYYVVKVITRDYDVLVDAFADQFTNDQDMSTSAMVYYLSKYDFEVHDQWLFDYWKANSPEYLVSRPDLTEDDAA